MGNPQQLVVVIVMENPTEKDDNWGVPPTLGHPHLQDKHLNQEKHPVICALSTVAQEDGINPLPDAGVRSLYTRLG